MNEFYIGIFLIIISGSFIGLFSTGVTRTSEWAFENIWGLGSLLALLLIPWPLALFTLNDVGEIFETTDAKIIIITFLCGIGWGVGGIYWGKAIAAVGMALGISLLTGLVNVFGSIGPMIIYSPQTLITKGGITLIVAILVMIVGVLIISLAGKQKEKELSSDSENQSSQKKNVSLWIGLSYCIISGVLSALVNIGFIYGTPIAEITVNQGNVSWASGFAIWALIFTGNYLVNIIYSLALMVKNGSFQLYFKKSKTSYWLWALFMGITWPVGIVLYGIAANMMGEYGVYIGFPMMLLFSVVAGNLAGVFNGEWKGTGQKSRMLMILGILVLFTAFVFLSYANKLL